MKKKYQSNQSTITIGIVVAVVLIVIALALIMPKWNTLGAAVVVEHAGNTYTLSHDYIDTTFKRASLINPNITKAEVVQSLVQREILSQQAMRAGIEVNQSAVDALVDQQTSQIMGDEAFMQALSEKDLTREQFRANLVEATKADALIDAYLRAAVLNNIAITEEQVQQAYLVQQNQFVVPQRIFAGHILICHSESVGCANERSKQDALALAAQVANQVTPDNFAEVASQVSEDPSGVIDLGAIVPGQTVPTFESALFATPVGQISDPVETPFGYHIIYPYQRADAGLLEYQDVRDPLAQQIIGQQYQTLLPAYIKGITDSAVVDVKIELS